MHYAPCTRHVHVRTRMRYLHYEYEEFKMQLLPKVYYPDKVTSHYNDRKYMIEKENTPEI